MTMCCFSQPIDLVSGTNIFARRTDNGRQLLAYSMTYAASLDLAMVLPLPVPPNSSETAVRFINLERYPEFFGDMKLGFSLSFVEEADLESLSGGATTLKVLDVGSYEASFVPTIADFRRLDERFRIPESVWDKLPVYHDYGFAVFKLRETNSLDDADLRNQQMIYEAFKSIIGDELPDVFDAYEQAKAENVVHAKSRKVHPMAFEFPSRNPDLLFFPTVHIHDGDFHHDSADFDHLLYCQADANFEVYLDDWEKTPESASSFMDMERAGGLIDPARHCWRISLGGSRQNIDTNLGTAGEIPSLV